MAYRFAATVLAGTLLLGASAVQASPVGTEQDRAAAKVQGMVQPGTGLDEGVDIEVRSGGAVLWAGSLRLGSPYGSASFSQSKNEFAPPCPGQLINPNRSMNSESLNVSVSRNATPQDPDRFNVSVNWTRPLSPCQGEGSDSFGANRVVSVPRGRTETLAAGDGVVLRLTRGR